MKKAGPQNNFLYTKQSKGFARNLRGNMTKAEACLWKYVLKARQMKGYQFRRQRPVRGYIADFLCKELLLIIEVDGISHCSTEAIEKDRKRDLALQDAGFTILRFSNWEVLNRIDDVAMMIGDWIEEKAKNSPPPYPVR
ncbi:MAG: endonuclease domain-containing protein [Saprospirales bacterium]|nr:endonuclease domain-containing protein [Saprospirales bacterium]MBK8492946.1 endonuclease domain-containing protein [Saprospirales bacterium]